MRELLAALVLPLAFAGPEYSLVVSFLDPDIVESSGLAVVDGFLVTTNDSGDEGRVFVVDSSGATVGVTKWSAEPRDVEAIAPGRAGEVWVGDIGDNSGVRDSISVTQVKVGAESLDVDAPSYELVYPDGARDAETLMSDPTTGRLYVATKEIFGGVLYAAPKKLEPRRPNLLTEVGEVMAIATDGAFFADGRNLIIRGYDTATVYSFPTLEEVGEIELPDQEQGEGLAVTLERDLLISSEGQFSDVYRVELPDDIKAVVDGTTPPSTSPTRPPTESREGKDLPETTEAVRSPWPWFLSGFIGLGIIMVLMRSLRRR